VTPTVATPFRQLPFRDLPERPRIPHRWAEVETHRAVIATEAYGELDTAWYTYGSGPPLLLVHGLMTAAWSWRYVLPLLGDRFTLVMPDLPGSGATAKPDATYEPDRLADWLGGFVGRLGLRGCAAIGNSLGGYLALRLAIRDPGALGRLVDLHSPGVPLARLWALAAVIRMPGAERLLRALVHRDPERWVHRNVHYYDESLKSLEEARVWAEPLRSVEGVRAFHRILRDTLDPRQMRAFLGELHRVSIPTLLVYATTDPLVPPWIGDALAERIPGAGLVRLDQASHFAHVDAPDRFVAAVDAFLAQGTRSDSSRGSTANAENA
jgi:pimeloyl-ACP methyl ester carboxylesterase